MERQHGFHKYFLTMAFQARALHAASPTGMAALASLLDLSSAWKERNVRQVGALSGKKTFPHVSGACCQETDRNCRSRSTRLNSPTGSLRLLTSLDANLIC